VSILLFVIENGAGYVNVKPLAAVRCVAGVLIVLSSWLDLTESFLPAENFLFSIHGFCI
jgi:hypothetical protein